MINGSSLNGPDLALPTPNSLDDNLNLFYKWTAMAPSIPNKLHKTLTTPEALVSAGLAEPNSLLELQSVADRYATAIPTHLVGLIKTDTFDNPIAKQFVPSIDELTVTPEERPDPIGDYTHSPTKGLVHRYPDRVLLKVQSACAVYCRFCFRREMVGPGGESMNPEDIERALTYIRDHEEIWEVILTGGDPLVLSPEKVSRLLDQLEGIPHVQVVRFHTRLPIAAPERISDTLVKTLTNRRFTVYVAIHTNHAKELSPDVISACNRLTQAGIPLVGQSVLLKGVNDSAETMAALFRAMVRARIKPYYLSHPDLAPGTSHFRVPIATGQALMQELRGTISGIALPTYILDIPGGYGKVPIEATYIHESGPDSHLVNDVKGERHQYPPGPEA